jgi:dCTP diphosphatase
MPDETTTIKTLLDEMTQFLDERDWHQFHSPKNLTMGLAIETSELMEHFQWVTEKESRNLENDSAQKKMVQDELADVLSYILSLAISMNIDLSDAFIQKMKKNRTKYPADQYRGRYKLKKS